MEVTLDKKKDGWVDWYLKYSNPYRDIHSTENSKINIESLREFIHYFSKLNKENIIDENQLRDILIRLCSNYIENEVESRISKKMNETFFTFFEKAHGR